MNALGPLFRRQYLLTRGEDGFVPDGFRQVELKGGHLCHCPELAVEQVTGADGHAWTLLGDAVDGEGQGSPAEALRRCTEAQVPAAYGSWEGRWLLLGEDSVHLDGMGYLPAFHTDDAVASTPGLLAPGRLPRPPLSRGDICDWFPGPLSGIAGVRRVLPSQALRLSDRATVSRPLPTARELSQEEALGAMAELLVAAVRGLDAERVVVPLTAGWDSRLMLAACVAAGVRPLCITLAYPSLSRSDRDLPPQLARLVGSEHLLVRPRGWVRGAGSLYDAQVAGHIRETDRRFLQRGQYGWTRPGDVLLRGLSLDITRMSYHREIPDGPPDLEALSATLLPSPVQREGLRAYLDWVERDPQPVPWPYRFDLEQGQASWASMSDVALDLTGVRGLNLGNSRAYQGAALALPDDVRVVAAHHTALIERLAPDLVGLPVNPPENRWTHPGRITAALNRRGRRALGRTRRRAEGLLPRR